MATDRKPWKSPWGETLMIPTEGEHAMRALRWEPVDPEPEPEKAKPRAKATRKKPAASK